MRQYMVKEGTRAEVLAELRRYQSDREPLGAIGRWQEFTDAIAALEHGPVGAEYMAEHILYRIVED